MEELSKLVDCGDAAQQIRVVTSLTFRGSCIVMYSYNKTKEVH